MRSGPGVRARFAAALGCVASGLLLTSCKGQAVRLAPGDADEPAALFARGAAIAAHAAPSAQPASPRLTRLEYWIGQDAVRAVLEIDATTRFRVEDEKAPRGARTLIELDGVELGIDPRDVALDGIVRRLRVQSTSTGSRLMMDVDEGAYRRVFYLPEPYRIVVDVARRPSPRLGAGRQVARVALDPGHGGSDPGAVGGSGIKEKDIALDIAHRVAPVLARQGIGVVLTRDRDTFVSLEERTARANAFSADLFVSIHCNAADHGGRRGVETYVLDTTHDDVAARVAVRENATSAGATSELGAILANMRMADQSLRSTKLARLLQKATVASLRPTYADALDGGVHTAGFYVLVGARMPSVLLEASYLSHPAEERRLADASYRQRIADGIANAIRAYREGR